MRLSKTFTFDAAHHLPDYKGKCANVHGHSWTLEVVVEGKVNEKTGMLIDFGLLKSLVQNNVLEKLDHHDLNTIIPNPTAENIAVYVFKHLKDLLSLTESDIKLTEVSIWEQPTSKVTYP